MTTQKEYWDRAIIGWDERTYVDNATGDGVIERLAKRFGAKNLLLRQEFALKQLTPRVEGKRILEVGCGTGRLSLELARHGAASVYGIDISESAIKSASQRFTEAGIDASRFKFEDKQVSELLEDMPEFDIVVGLGILQYLTADERARLLRIASENTFFFEFHENDFTLNNVIHFCYRTLKSSFHTFPAYHLMSRAELRRAMQGDKKIGYKKSGVMSFTTNLPDLAADWGAL